MIEVELPDGSVAEFPDGTSPDVIKGALKKRFASGGEQRETGQPSHSGRSVPEFDPGVPGYDPKTGEVAPREIGNLGSAALGLANVGTFGLADEMSAGVNAALGRGSYDENLARNREIDQRAYDTNPGSYIAGGIAGGVGMGAGAARAGLSMGANAAGQSLPRMALGSAADGLVWGGLHGFGTGEGGIENRATSAGVGAGVGAVTGFAAPLAVAAGSGLLRGGTNLIGARLNPDKATQRALAKALERSGMSADDVGLALDNAKMDGQDVFAVGDAMGLTGQRLTSTAARTPHDNRQALIEALDRRQSGQGRRVAAALDDAFDSSNATAKRLRAASKANRSSTGNINYGQARADAGAVDSGPAIALLDEKLTPGVTAMIGTGADDGGVFKTLGKMRGLLTNGKAQVSDFDRALAAKIEMDAVIEKGGPAAALLRPAREALDDALAASSKSYGTARDTWRAQSKAIEAIDTGQQAATRGRSADTIREFGAMVPDEQAGFRVGYADKLIEKVEGDAVGVNKVRPLINDAAEAEFPAFAVKGKADKLGRRIARENTMFETRAAATGGSKTADNVADMADMANFDPTIAFNLVSGNWKAAAMNAASRSVNSLRGLPPSVLARLADTLMETDPSRARHLLKAAEMNANLAGKRAGQAALASGLTSVSAAGGGRLVSP